LSPNFHGAIIALLCISTAIYQGELRGFCSTREQLATSQDQYWQGWPEFVKSQMCCLGFSFGFKISVPLYVAVFVSLLIPES
jgi:hypothetical protein